MTEVKVPCDRGQMAAVSNSGQRQQHASLGRGQPEDGVKAESTAEQLPGVKPPAAAAAGPAAPLTSGRRWLYCCAAGVISSICAPCPFLSLFQPMASRRRPSLPPLSSLAALRLPPSAGSSSWPPAQLSHWPYRTLVLQAGIGSKHGGSGGSGQPRRHSAWQSCGARQGFRCHLVARAAARGCPPVSLNLVVGPVHVGRVQGLRGHSREGPALRR